MATIDEFVLKNIGLWWKYGISRHYDECKYSIIGRIFESEIILIPPSLKISESSSNGSYRNTDKVWWRYGISRSCDEWLPLVATLRRRESETERAWTIRVSSSPEKSLLIIMDRTMCKNVYKQYNTVWLTCAIKAYSINNVNEQNNKQKCI